MHDRLSQELANINSFNQQTQVGTVIFPGLQLRPRG